MNQSSKSPSKKAIKHDDIEFEIVIDRDDNLAAVHHKGTSSMTPLKNKQPAIRQETPHQDDEEEHPAHSESGYEDEDAGYQEDHQSNAASSDRRKENESDNGDIPKVA